MKVVVVPIMLKTLIGGFVYKIILFNNIIIFSLVRHVFISIIKKSI